MKRKVVKRRNPLALEVRKIRPQVVKSKKVYNRKRVKAGLDSRLF